MNNLQPDIVGLVDDGLLDLDHVFDFGWVDFGRKRPEWTMGEVVGQFSHQAVSDDGVLLNTMLTADVRIKSATVFGLTAYRWCIVWSDGVEHDECGPCRLSLDAARADGIREAKKRNEDG